ncbi:hypothetical protein HK405_001234 [Cladochytrium tenue]|nr:hypothetical protein HK405_001234 [Cladochytrium tenue]
MPCGPVVVAAVKARLLSQSAHLDNCLDLVESKCHAGIQPDSYMYKSLFCTCEVSGAVVFALRPSASSSTASSPSSAVTETPHYHPAGIHTKAVLNNPDTYEILRPQDFGVERRVSLAHRLTGWNAVRDRARQLGLELSDDEIKDVTKQIKRLADIGLVSDKDVEVLLEQASQKGK